LTRARLVWLLIALAALLVWRHGRARGAPVGEEEPPIDWSRDPIQGATDRAPFEVETRKGPATLTPRAAYDIAGVVAGAERYRFDDPALVSPLDLALTWGEVPTPAWRDRLDFSQGYRLFYWRTADLGLDAGYLIRHTANTHLIPANRNLERALLGIDAGDEVQLSGLLVDVAAHGFRWPTSLVRTDHGDQGCEILYVEEVRVADRRYR
jgi:hypothetical protein